MYMQMLLFYVASLQNGSDVNLYPLSHNTNFPERLLNHWVVSQPEFLFITSPKISKHAYLIISPDNPPIIRKYQLLVS